MLLFCPQGRPTGAISETGGFGELHRHMALVYGAFPHLAMSAALVLPVLLNHLAYRFSYVSAKYSQGTKITVAPAASFSSVSEKTGPKDALYLAMLT